MNNNNEDKRDFTKKNAIAVTITAILALLLGVTSVYYVKDDASPDTDSIPEEVIEQEESSVMDYMVENFDVEGAEDGFITSIEGYEADSGEFEGMYWMYYVDGEMPSVGADEYELSEDELVDWKLESVE